MSKQEDPTTCDVCKNAIKGSWVQTYSAKGKLLESACEACDLNRRREKYRADGRLSTRLVMQASLANYRDQGDEHEREVDAAAKLVEAEIKAFDRDVWFGGLQKLAQNAKTKGTKAERDGFTLMCWTCAGRAMITLETKTASVTTITAEDEPESRMGLQGIDATVGEAIDLLRTARRLWRDGMRVTEDREVTLAVPGMGPP